MFDGRPRELHRPNLTVSEEVAVVDCVRSGFVSSVGECVEKFEQSLASFTHSTSVVAVSSGTAALEVALRLAGVSVDEEVVCPALTFIGTANAISHLGATPYLVDSEEHTFGIDPHALRQELSRIATVRGGEVRNRRTNRRIAAIVPVHLFGHPCDLTQLLQISHEFAIPIVEDAAESLGSFHGVAHTGTVGVLGTLSFNGNKIVTTGGGGAILTSDLELGAKARHLTTTARVGRTWRFSHDEVGYNYRLPNINAALGYSQMEKLPRFVEAKRRLFNRYRAEFGDLRGANLVSEPTWGSSNYWLVTLLLDRGLEHLQEEIIESSRDHGYNLRPVWTPLHLTKPYSKSQRAPLPVAEGLANRIINLPSGSDSVNFNVV